MDFNLSNLGSLDETINLVNEYKTHETNKENFISSNQELLLPRSSRKSLLQSLDPLNPYSSPIHSTGKFEKIKENTEDSITTNVMNQSWNFINLENENPIISKPINNLSETPLNSFANEDLLCSMDNLYVPLNMSADSQMLDESVEEENPLVVDNLLPISPLKQFVAKSVHDKLKRIHKTKQQEWSVTEGLLRDEITRLQRDYEAEKSIIVVQNEEKLSQLLNTHTIAMKTLKHEHQIALAELNRERDSLMSDLLKENEDQLETQRQDQTRLLSSQQTSIDCMKVELEQLRNDVESLNSARMIDMMIIEQYSDTIVTMDGKHRNENEAILNDNRELEEMLNKCLTKVNLSKTVITSLEENNAKLEAERSALKNKMEQLHEQLKNKSDEVTSAMVKHTRDFDELVAENERQLRRKDIRVAMLENTEVNLKAELELRTRDRDQLQATLKEMFQCQ